MLATNTVHQTMRGDGYYDQIMDTHLVSVMAGVCHWTKSSDIAFSTTLGSCVSVCAYDTHAGIGGMNHFILPMAPENEDNRISRSFRYGSAAIESLLNALYSHGAAKNGLHIKLFGGGKVLNKVSDNVGQRNIDFARRYFQRENIRIESEDVGGDKGRRIIFFPQTGKVLMRSLGDKKELQNIATQEKKLLKTLSTERGKDDIELF